MSFENVTIETTRLLLVPIQEQHAEDIFCEFTPIITTYMLPKSADSIEETHTFIRLSILGMKEGSNVQCVVIERATRDFLGCVGLHSIGTDDPEVGIWIKEGAHGKGYGLEAVGVILAWARSHISYSHIRYPVDKRNTASRRIAEAYGGQLKNEYSVVNMSGFLLNEVEYWIYP